MKLKSFITSYTNEDDLKNKISLVWPEYIKLEIDWKDIKNKQSLFELFYKTINWPDYFWYNWSAFWDTISDQKYWIDKKLVIIIKDKNNLFIEEDDNNSINLLYEILIDLVDLDWYFIFIEK